MTDAPKPNFWIKTIIHKDEMLMIFSAPTDMITLDADSARDMGHKLIEFAETVKPARKMQ